MAELITKTQLENASLDSDSLAKFTNGGVTEDVTTRTGAVYPTLQKFRQILVPLSRQYMSLSDAQADVANIPLGSATYVHDDDDKYLASEYVNQSGTLVATGKKWPSQHFVEYLESLLSALTDNVDLVASSGLNDSFDLALIDNSNNIWLTIKNGLFDFYSVSINGVLIDAAGILKAYDKENLEKLSESADFEQVPSDLNPVSYMIIDKDNNILFDVESYNAGILNPEDKNNLEKLSETSDFTQDPTDLNPVAYIIVDENNNILFDVEDYIANVEKWNSAYEFSLQPPKTNPYAPFPQIDGNGKSQIHAINTETNKEYIVTSGSSNETNPRSDLLNSIVWTSDNPDGAPGGLFYADAPEFVKRPYISRSKIVGWGHSFMENGQFLNKLCQLTGLYTYNFGKSGLTSEGIASRQGGVRTFYVPVGGSIPASGSVTLNPAKPGPNRIFGNAAASNIACSFGGVDGLFGWDGTNATFTRNSEGSAVTVSEPTPIIVYPITGFSVTGGAPGGTRYDNHDECINIFWLGRNNISELDLIMYDAIQMVEFLKSRGKRFVILPEFPGSSEPTGSAGNNNVLAINAMYKSRYPENYCEIDGVDLLQNFKNNHNPAYPDDVTDIANGVTPRSLRYDHLHPSQSKASSLAPDYALDAGANVNAIFVYNFMKLRGWVN